jgi:predicted methyltransferase
MQPRRRHLATLLAAASLPAWAQPAAGDAAAEAALRAAVDHPLRTPAYRARDAARHPVETLRSFGLQPQHTVVEVAPGGGWYTEILAPCLKAQGRLYAAHESATDPDEGRRKSRAAFEARLAAQPALFERVQLGSLPRGPRFADIAPPGGADVVLTFRNLHNWIEDDTLDAMLQAFFAVLKPGGVLGVEEHRAPPGASLDWVRRNGYVPEALATERARAAGFVLLRSSEVNANPRDTKDHPNGVWSLPPTLRGGEVDRARYLAIGESDRFTHCYQKPLA